MQKQRISAKPVNAIFRSQGPLGFGNITCSGFGSNTTGVTHWRDFPRYGMSLMLGGRGEYRDANGLRQKIQAGDLLFIFPGLKHKYGPLPGELWMERFFDFQGPFFDLLRASKILDPQRPILRLAPVDYWRQRLEDIFVVKGETTLPEAYKENARLLEFFMDAWVCPDRRTTTLKQEGWLTRAQAQIELKPRMDDDLSSVATALGLARDSFRKRFTQQAGEPPTRYHARIIIQRACKMMQQGGRSDKEIAMLLGFYDEFHFSKRFKQLTGESPRAFRRGIGAAAPGRRETPARRM